MMKYYRIFSIVLLVLAFTIMAQDVFAQCPMCRLSAETNLENGGTAGKGLNTGILYLLSMPYLLIGTIAFVWIRNKRKSENEVIE